MAKHVVLGMMALKTEESKREAKADKLATKAITFTIPEIDEALRMFRGNITKASEVLGIKRTVLQRKVYATPSLVKTLRDIEEEKLDRAEEVLDELIEDKNPTATIFKLRTKGKERGYTEKSTVEHEIGDKTRSSAGLIAAMQSGAKKVSDEDDDDVVEVTAKLLEDKEASCPEPSPE